jgi:galactokinase
MVPELGMDYLIEVGTGEYYGPTTIGALKEFLRVGEIRMDMRITNCKDATEMLLQDLLTDEDDDTRNAANERYAYTGSIRLNLQQRIRELEALVMEERRGREAAEALANRLQERIAELEDRA